MEDIETLRGANEESFPAHRANGLFDTLNFIAAEGTVVVVCARADEGMNDSLFQFQAPLDNSHSEEAKAKWNARIYDGRETSSFRTTSDLTGDS